VDASCPIAVLSLQTVNSKDQPSLIGVIEKKEEEEEQRIDRC
jgi:hypothetical protein